MNLELSEELKLFQSTVRDFCKKEIIPHADEWDRKREFPKHLFKKMGELGYLGAVHSPECGGQGLGALGGAILCEELGYASAGVAVGIYVHTILALSAISYFGTPEQKQKYLIPGIKGEKIGCWGFAEPQTGSDPDALKTRASIKDGEYLKINGQKMFITNGTFADFVVLTVSLNPEKGAKGLSLITVDRGTQGFSSARLDTFGVRSCETAALYFEDCVVPIENFLGGQELGFGNIAKSLTLGRIAAAAFAVGLSRAAYEHSVKYSKERVVFGKPISKNQGIQWILSDMALKIESSRLLTYKAAWLYDTGLPHLLETSFAKLHATESCTHICERALQIFGGAGFLTESPVQRFYRDCKLLEIGEGTSQIHRNFIARLLGL